MSLDIAVIVSIELDSEMNLGFNFFLLENFIPLLKSQREWFAIEAEPPFPATKIVLLLVIFFSKKIAIDNNLFKSILLITNRKLLK
jgi:hypothetical protein